ncbi:Txe/YoeB family addiction module toxin [Endothiovibrio diazotrophicus]
MLRLTWTDTALEDLQWWADCEPKRLKRIISLCLAACKNPTSGIGKPEPLRYDYQGYWSRRIDHEHRLVYSFDEESVTVIQCRYHYER